MPTPDFLVGSYATDPGDTEIGACSLGGTVEGVGVSIPNPAFLIAAPDGTCVYSVQWVQDGHVAAFSVGPSGLTPLGSRRTFGSNPCHLAFTADRSHLLVAHYLSGSFTALPIQSDGALGEATDVLRNAGSSIHARQAEPHGHGVASVGEHVFLVDLGIDQVITCRLNDGRFEVVGRLAVPAGSGPRHIAFSPDGAVAYVICELNSTLLVCEHADGELSITQSLPTRAPSSSGDNLAAEVVVSADGRFVYASNRGDDTICIYESASGGADLRLLEIVSSGGAWPRHMAFAAGGSKLLVANEKSDSVRWFDVGPDKGALRPASAAVPWPNATCVMPLAAT